MENKFKVVSRIYSREFRTVTFVVFNSETGEFKKEVINMDDNENKTIDEKLHLLESVLDNIVDEIGKFQRDAPAVNEDYVWNNALKAALECCNGYK